MLPQNTACTVCTWDNNEHEAEDWLAFAPWNQHLLCSDCIAQMQTFQTHANRYTNVMNPEDIDAVEDVAPEDEDVVFILDNNGEIAEIFMASDDDVDYDPEESEVDEEEDEDIESNESLSVSTLSL